ncbi:type III secretion system protein SctP [Paraburkholderia phenazinium]|uniref:Type III secretion protein (HpaP) n=1 Tax=Paraburkholderia phenazinium TaxID=60549 RepID=A0A1G8K948_9BURK|nr:type III secretion system protein SctP [Paraburkholderia phenazinium]SDI39879.1 Type III secretion protein (HpaP) [Paraburkholderia phenazinium]
MSERARSAREIRIVPGTPNPASGGTRAAAPSAVQIFRSLAAQASALTGVTALAASPDEAGTPRAEAAEPQGAGEFNPPPDTVAGKTAPPVQEGGAEHQDGPAPATSSRIAAATAQKKTVEENRSASEETALGKHIVSACATAAHGEVLAQQLADRIARFCSMSGASDDASWEVTLPMNPAVLGDTLLHLQLSPSRIAIRFETSNPRSARLIYDNAETLRARLSDALHRRIDVDVVT